MYSIPYCNLHHLTQLDGLFCILSVFRTNASYQRWDEARKAWGVVVNNSRTIARQTSAWIKYSDLPSEEKQRLLRRTRDTVWAFPRTLARHLLSEREDEEAYCKAVQERLDEPFASELIRWKRHRPSRALFEMSNAINELPLETYRRIAVDESVSHLADAMGGCDRVSFYSGQEFVGSDVVFLSLVWLRCILYFCCLLLFCVKDLHVPDSFRIHSTYGPFSRDLDSLFASVSMECFAWSKSHCNVRYQCLLCPVPIYEDDDELTLFNTLLQQYPGFNRNQLFPPR